MSVLVQLTRYEGLCISANLRHSATALGFPATCLFLPLPMSLRVNHRHYEGEFRNGSNFLPPPCRELLNTVKFILLTTPYPCLVVVLNPRQLATGYLSSGTELKEPRTSRPSYALSTVVQSSRIPE